MKKKINGKIIFNIVTLLIPIGFIIYFLTSENGLMDLISNAEKFNWNWIFCAVAFQLLNVLIDAYILFRFTHNYDESYTMKKSLKATAVGQFFSVITPGAVGGQPMQLYCMKKQNVDTGTASSSLVQKFLVYQTIITFYRLISMLCNLDIFTGNMGGAMLGLALFGFISHALVITFVFMFSFNKKLTSSIINGCFNFLSKIKIIKNAPEKADKVKAQLEHFHQSNKKLYKNKKMLITTCFFTVLQLTFIFAIPYAIYRAFNFSGAKIFDMITGQAFVTMVSSFMPLPGGSGAAEGSFYVFFEMFFTQGTIKSAILVWRIITYFMNILIFAPFARVGNISETTKTLENI